jgi:hypothetical protein
MMYVSILFSRLQIQMYLNIVVHSSFYFKLRVQLKIALELEMIRIECTLKFGPADD